MGPSGPTPLPATTSYFSSMRSWFQVHSGPQPPGLHVGYFGSGSLFDVVVSMTPTLSHNVFSLLIVSISYSAFPPTPRFFLIQVF